MNPLSFIAAVTLTITIIEGIVILSRDYRSSVNRLFFLICAAMAVWTLGAGLGYSTQTRDDVFFWYRFASPGFIFLHAFVLHFVCRYTGLFSSNLVYLIYLPSLCFLYIGMTDTLVFSDIYKSGDFWVMVPDFKAPSFYLLMANYLGYYFTSLILLYRYMRNTKSRRIRRQSRLIFAAIIITIASYNIEPFLAPIFFDYLTYGQAPLYSIIWVSIIWYAMSKYRFLRPDEQHIYRDIFNSVREMVLILNAKMDVMVINRALQQKIGAESTGRPLHEIFVEYELLYSQIDQAQERPVSGIMLNLTLPGGGMSLVRASVSGIKDRFGDTTGYLLILQGVRERYSLLKKRGITVREYELIQLIMTGSGNREMALALGLSLRTVETHLTNIFAKLGLKNRTQLMNYCADLFSDRTGMDHLV